MSYRVYCPELFAKLGDVDFPSRVTVQHRRDGFEAEAIIVPPSIWPQTPPVRYKGKRETTKSDAKDALYSGLVAVWPACADFLRFDLYKELLCGHARASPLFTSLDGVLSQMIYLRPPSRRHTLWFSAALEAKHSAELQTFLLKTVPKSPNSLSLLWPLLHKIWKSTEWGGKPLKKDVPKDNSGKEVISTLDATTKETKNMCLSFKRPGLTTNSTETASHVASLTFCIPTGHDAADPPQPQWFYYRDPRGNSEDIIARISVFGRKWFTPLVMREEEEQHDIWGVKHELKISEIGKEFAPRILRKRERVPVFSTLQVRVDLIKGDRDLESVVSDIGLSVLIFMLFSDYSRKSIWLFGPVVPCEETAQRCDPLLGIDISGIKLPVEGTAEAVVSDNARSLLMKIYNKLESERNRQYKEEKRMKKEDDERLKKYPDGNESPLPEPIKPSPDEFKVEKEDKKTDKGPVSICRVRFHPVVQEDPVTESKKSAYHLPKDDPCHRLLRTAVDCQQVARLLHKIIRYICGPPGIEVVAALEGKDTDTPVSLKILREKAAGKALAIVHLRSVIEARHNAILKRLLVNPAEPFTSPGQPPSNFTPLYRNARQVRDEEWNDKRGKRIEKDFDSNLLWKLRELVELQTEYRAPWRPLVLDVALAYGLSYYKCSKAAQESADKYRKTFYIQEGWGGPTEMFERLMGAFTLDLSGHIPEIVRVIMKFVIGDAIWSSLAMLNGRIPDPRDSAKQVPANLDEPTCSSSSVPETDETTGTVKVQQEVDARAPEPTHTHFDDLTIGDVTQYMPDVNQIRDMVTHIDMVEKVLKGEPRRLEFPPDSDQSGSDSSLNRSKLTTEQQSKQQNSSRQAMPSREAEAPPAAESQISSESEDQREDQVSVSSAESMFNGSPRARKSTDLLDQSGSEGGTKNQPGPSYNRDVMPHTYASDDGSEPEWSSSSEDGSPVSQTPATDRHSDQGAEAEIPTTVITEEFGGSAGVDSPGMNIHSASMGKADATMAREFAVVDAPEKEAWGTQMTLRANPVIDICLEQLGVDWEEVNEQLARMIAPEMEVCAQKEHFSKDEAENDLPEDLGSEAGSDKREEIIVTVPLALVEDSA